MDSTKFSLSRDVHIIIIWPTLKNNPHFFKVGQIMFKWTFLEGENIVEFKTGLHLSLRGLDAEIMSIKDWSSPYSTESASAICAGPVN